MFGSGTIDCLISPAVQSTRFNFTFQFKFTTKQLERLASKAEKEQKKEQGKVKKV